MTQAEPQEIHALTARLPEALWAEIVHAAAQERRTVNSQLILMLEHAVGRADWRRRYGLPGPVRGSIIE